MKRAEFNICAHICDINFVLFPLGAIPKSFYAFIDFCISLQDQKKKHKPSKISQRDLTLFSVCREFVPKFVISHIFK